VITLVSDKAYLAGDYARPTDEHSILRFRYQVQVLAKQDWAYSQWQLLKGASPAVACLVNPVLAAQDKWALISAQDMREFFRVRKPSYILPEEPFARAQTTFEELTRARRCVQPC
jgi:hypothetical protein